MEIVFKSSSEFVSGSLQSKLPYIYTNKDPLPPPDGLDLHTRPGFKNYRSRDKKEHVLTLPCRRRAAPDPHSSRSNNCLVPSSVAPALEG